MSDLPSEAQAPDHDGPSRRRFFQLAAAFGAGAKTLLSSGSVQAAVADARQTVALPWPPMTYRTLGRTGHEASRLVFGCGAALSRKPNDRLLETALEAGVNTFDVGFGRYYDDAEKNMAGFLARHRSRLFLISKAYMPLEADPDSAVTPAQARAAADQWLAFLDESLRDLGVEQVDAYYAMAAFNPSLVGSDEAARAYERARTAGKTRFIGLSTHQNAQAVLAEAVACGHYDLAMVAVTPGGWYDFKDRAVLPDSPPMVDLVARFDRAREAGMGLIGMKAARFLAGRRWLGWGNPEAFDPHYSAEFAAQPLSEFQKSYAFVLGHGLDCVNSDIQSLDHLRENFLAAATSHQHFGTDVITRTA